MIEIPENFKYKVDHLILLFENYTKLFSSNNN